MVWNWQSTFIEKLADADIDYDLSHPLGGHEYMSAKPIDPKMGMPVFKTRSKIESFTKLHCPPIGTSPVVDQDWIDIIRQFATDKEVLFHPIKLIGRGGETTKFSWVVCLQERVCIDVDKSKIRDKSIGNSGVLIIWEVDEYVYVENCLGDRHIALDQHKLGHIVISDALRDALAATGEDSMFYRAEDIPTWRGKNSIFDS